MKTKKPKDTQIRKSILYTVKIIQFFSVDLVTKLAAMIFTTPIKHTIPKRELQMDKNSTQVKIIIPTIRKEIIVYQYGEGKKKVLLVHGWSGRGTQLVKIADELVQMGYQIISFDAPAHGKSQGKNTLMPEFIASILEIEKQFGPFEFAIGHSLGGLILCPTNSRNPSKE